MHILICATYLEECVSALSSFLPLLTRLCARKNNVFGPVSVAHKNIGISVSMLARAHADTQTQTHTRNVFCGVCACVCIFACMHAYVTPHTYHLIDAYIGGPTCTSGSLCMSIASREDHLFVSQVGIMTVRDISALISLSCR